MENSLINAQSLEEQLIRLQKKLEEQDQFIKALQVSSNIYSFTSNLNKKIEIDLLF